MKRLIPFATLIVAIVLGAPLTYATDVRTEKPLIQLALLLDTSNSMDGLIDQARSQLWTVVNHLAKCKRDGQSPRLEVALYEYGNDSLSPKNGWVRQVLPFTEDLDSVSEKLFALKTNGGEEYCGKVIESAMNELKWSDSSGVYKTIFIAGNEPFTQGNVDYRSSCSNARSHGVIVNTIHCGSIDEGISGKWEDGAKIGGGKFLCINQDRQFVAIAAPQDAEIAQLSADLNKTYIPYGQLGGESLARQEAQDAFAATQPAAAAAGAPVQRAVSKANGLYKNGNWDLVDAVVNDKSIKLDDLKEADLPADMKKMNSQQRQDFIAAKSRERGEIQQKINTLNGDREKFIAEKRKESGKSDTLDAAMLNAVDEELTSKHFEQAK
jgi:hypothetical protein